MYKRIANAKDDEGLRELQVEMIDRFGILPPQVNNLVRQTSIKLKAEKLDVVKLDAGAGSGRLEFAEDTCVDPYTLIKLVQSQPKVYKLDGATAFKFTIPMEKAETRFQTIEALLDTLSNPT
jgi:transcription-repair coupling factor (superfamily II helicase)